MHRALLVVGLAATVGCTQGARAPTAPRVDEQAIATMLDDWHAAASQANEARYFDHLDDRAVFLGTDATERWDKPAFRAYAHPHFSEGRAWSFRATRRAIAIDTQALAHFDEELETVSLGPARGSGVVIREADGAWKVLQYNLTITVPNARFSPTREAAGDAVVISSKGDALADLGFLAGAWVAHEKNETTLEQWSPADGATMLGHGRTVRDGKLTFFETLRIEQRGASTVYVAQPNGASPTEFVRVPSSAPQSAVFENHQHDWPKRITYTRVGSELRARVEGAPGQRVVAWTLRAAVIDRSGGAPLSGGSCWAPADATPEPAQHPTPMTTETPPTELQQAITKLQGFRDEILLRLHLGSLDAKQQWDTLDPQIAELEKLGHDASDAAKEKLHALVTKVGELRASFAEK